MSSDRLNEFFFRTFSVDNAANSDQTLFCKIIICEGVSCGTTKITEATCPTEQTPIYQWKNLN